MLKILYSTLWIDQNGLKWEIKKLGNNGKNTYLQNIALPKMQAFLLCYLHNKSDPVKYKTQTLLNILVAVLQ